MTHASVCYLRAMRGVDWVTCLPVDGSDSFLLSVGSARLCGYSQESVVSTADYEPARVRPVTQPVTGPRSEKRGRGSQRDGGQLGAMFGEQTTSDRHSRFT